MKTGMERDKVVKIINSVIEKVQKVDDGTRTSLYHEIKSLHDIIENVRREISFARPADISGKHIPNATDELDAVVAATAEATSTIMDSCEIMQSHFSKLDPAVSEEFEREVMKIYEACSFQDITGQRITKVVKTLRDIDEKVTKILGLFGDKLLQSSGEAEDTRQGDAVLLNGPQLPGQGVTQADIDKLLAEFD
jgi:chemotaxis protein CheZ